MAKDPAPSPSVSAGTLPRERPPKPGGRVPQVEVQRAYHARLAAAGKIVRVVDAIPASPALASIPGTEFEAMRERLHNALLRLELREQDVARLEQRNAYLEGELKLQGQHHTNALKEVITLGRQLAEKLAKRG
jgi:hypothetical protein